jgi:hypothetical protein
LERLEQGLVVVADRQYGELWVFDRQLTNHLKSAIFIGVQGNDGEIGRRFADHVEKVFVACTLGFEPDKVHAEQERSEGLSGRFRWIYDRDTLHGHHRVS